MGFSGDLRTIDLANIFQTISMNQMTGTLHVFAADEERHLFFEGGEVAYFSWGREALWVGKIVVGKGMLPAARFQALARDLTRAGRRPGLGEFCQAAGIPEEGLRELVQRVIQEQIYDIFGWKEARFIFEEGPLPGAYFDADLQSFRIQANWSNLILEAARRQDENKVIRKWVKSDRDVYVRQETDGLPEIAVYEGYEPEVFGLINGENSVEDVANRTGLGIFPVSQLFSTWQRENRIRPLAIEELKSHGEAALRNRGFGVGIRYFGRASQMEPDDVGLRLKLIRCLEEEKQWERAAQEYVQLAEHKRRAGDLRECIRYLRRALKVFPQNSLAPSRLLQALKELKRDWEVLVEGRRLVKAHRAREQTEAAKGIYERMLEWFPDHGDLREEFARFLDDEGKREEAIKAYESVADLWTPRRAYRRAIAACESILRLDPKNDGAKSRLAAIRRAQRGRRRRAAVGLVVLLAEAVVEGWLLYAYVVREWSDAGAFQAALRRRVEPELSGPVSTAEAHENALVKLQEFLDGHPEGLHPDVRQQVEDVREWLNRLVDLLKRNRVDDDHEGVLARLRAKLRDGETAFQNKRYRDAQARFQEIVAAQAAHPWLRGEEVLETASRHLKATDGQLERLADSLGAYRRDVEAGRRGDALVRAVRIRQEFPNDLDRAGAPRVPVEVRVSPENAEVLVDGKPPVERSASDGGARVFVVGWDPGDWSLGPGVKPIYFSARAPGFQAASKRLTGHELRWAREHESALRVELNLAREALWEFSRPPGEAAPVEAPLALEGGRLWVQDRRGRLAAFRLGREAAGGTPLLGEVLLSASGGFPDAPVFAGDRLWLGSTDGSVRSLRTVGAAGGAVSLEPDPPWERTFTRERAGVAGVTADGRVLVWSADGRAQLYGPDGRAVWENPVPVVSAPERLSVRPAFDGRTAYFGAPSGDIIAVDANPASPNRRVLFHPPEGEAGGPDTPFLLDDGILYYGSLRRVRAVGVDGRGRWRMSQQTDRAPVEIAAGPGGVFFGTTGGALYRIRREDGFVLLNKPVGAAGIAGAPAVSPSSVYVNTTDGWVYALDMDGNPRWNYRPWPAGDGDETVFGVGPVLSGSTLYVASRQGRVQAIEVGAGPPGPTP